MTLKPSPPTSGLRVLVTGASGLVGHAVVSDLVAAGAEVWAAVHRGAAPAGSKPVVLDLAERDLAAALPSGIDAVVHLAQSNRFREFPVGAQDVFAVNVASTAGLLTWAARAGARRFILASSGAVYAPASVPLSEQAPLLGGDNRNYYAASKLAAEHLTAAYGDQLTTTRLRFFFVYGPRQQRSMLLPRLVDQVREGRPLLLDGADGLRLNPIHVADAARAVCACVADDRPGVYNVAGPSATSLRELGEVLGGLVGVPPRFEERSPSGAVLLADIAAMSRELGAPTVSLREGLGDLVAGRA